METFTHAVDQGITRRDLMRRGAVVGGSLMWAAPAVQSFARPAFAQASPIVVGECAGWVTGGPNLGVGPGVVTSGLGQINCDGSGPTNIQVNWDGNSAHFTLLTRATCCDANPRDGSCFDTITGTARGTLNNTLDATLEFTLADLGEPGVGVDRASFRITVDDETNPRLDVSGAISGGTIQAHSPPNVDCECPDCP